MRPEVKEDFKRELTSLINCYSIDAELGLPDYKVAEYLINHLMFITQVVAKTRRTKGADPL